MNKSIIRGSFIAIIVVIAVGCGGIAPSSLYPLPETVKTFNENGSPDAINFQTDLATDDVISFYREALSERGFTERKALFVHNEGVVSMVFDDDSAEAVVVQAVALPTGMTNVNVRKEAL